MVIAKTTAKGHVIIPAFLRRKFNIKKGSKVAISEGQGGVIVIKPIPDDPIRASRGLLKGETSLIKALLAERREEAGRG